METKIPKRKLGSNGLEVSAIGLGCMGMTFSYAPFPEKKESIALIHKAVEQGVTTGTRYTEALEKTTGF